MPLAAQHADIPRLHSLALPHSSRSAGAALAPAGSGSPGCGEQMAREGRLCWGGGHTPGGAAREERESIPGTREEAGEHPGRSGRASLVPRKSGEHLGVPGRSRRASWGAWEELAGAAWEERESIPGSPGSARGDTREQLGGIPGMCRSGAR